MNMLFRRQGVFVRAVLLTEGDYDLDSGETQDTYTAFSTLAVFGSAEYRSLNFLNLKENMVLLKKRADFLVRDGVVSKLKLEREHKGNYIYHMDRVENDAVLLASSN